MSAAGNTRHLLLPRPYPRKLSFIIPIYNEEESLPLLRAALEGFLKELPAEGELILVNDGSADSALPRIMDWAPEDRRVKILHLSRNFGHQIASTAGLDDASGDALIPLDARTPASARAGVGALE